jgi:hypothetical protein
MIFSFLRTGVEHVLSSEDIKDGWEVRRGAGKSNVTLSLFSKSPVLCSLLLMFWR